jgi:hypothetical protein
MVEVGEMLKIVKGDLLDRGVLRMVVAVGWILVKRTRWNFG